MYLVYIIELPFDIYIIIAIHVTDVITLRNSTSTQCIVLVFVHNSGVDETECGMILLY